MSARSLKLLSAQLIDGNPLNDIDTLARSGAVRLVMVGGNAIIDSDRWIPEQSS